MPFLYRGEGCDRADNSACEGQRNQADCQRKDKEQRAGELAYCRVEGDEFLADDKAGNDVDDSDQCDHPSPDKEPQGKRHRRKQLYRTRRHKDKISGGVELFPCFADRVKLPRSRAVQHIGKTGGYVKYPERRRKHGTKQYRRAENHSGNGDNVRELFFRKISSLYA